MAQTRAILQRKLDSISNQLDFAIAHIIDLQAAKDFTETAIQPQGDKTGVAQLQGRLEDLAHQLHILQEYSEGKPVRAPKPCRKELHPRKVKGLYAWYRALQEIHDDQQGQDDVSAPGNGEDLANNEVNDIVSSRPSPSVSVRRTARRVPIIWRRYARSERNRMPRDRDPLLPLSEIACKRDSNRFNTMTNNLSED